MAQLTHLVDSVRDSYRSAVDFFLTQVVGTSPGWGVEPGTEPDPWTTSQVLFSLSGQDSIPSVVIDKTVNWLEEAQNIDGSWGSVAYGRQGDTPATSWATISLARTLGQDSAAAQKGLKWLCSQFCQGWTTLPTTDRQPFQVCHLYSTAQALRALVRGKRHHLNSLYIQEGLTILARAREKRRGWGFQADSPSDPTFTAYILHALYDIQSIWGLEVRCPIITEAVQWLVSVQRENGAWHEWHGVSSSPEATGYCIFCLLCSGLEMDLGSIMRGLSWLLEIQKPDGGWQLDPSTDEPSNNWVTHTVLLGLKTFWFSYANQAIIHDSAGATLARDASRQNLLPAAVENSGIPIDSLAAVTEDSADYVIPSLRTLSSPSIDLKELYSVHAAGEWARLPQARPMDHTMYDALDVYVEDKLPTKDIDEIIYRGGRVEVHGIYPDHFEGVAAHIGFADFERLNYPQKPETKRFNSVRPVFYRTSRKTSESVIVAAVIPGRDYFYHYATMIRHHILKHTREAETTIKLFRYPYAERQIASWSGLGPDLVREGDHVMIGYVGLAEEIFRDHNEFEHLGTKTSSFYESNWFRLPNGSIVNLLGVKFCFWGSISERLAYKLCSLGVTEIIYTGKLGALSSLKHVYSRIFCPSHFVLLYHDQFVYRVTPPVNRLLRMSPSIDSGCHISVPTVMEEDYVQRELAASIRAQSIDNEVSQIAHAVSLYNTQNDRSIAFTAIHLATDYIRRPDERDLEMPFDLGHDKTTEAKQRKLTLVRHIIAEYVVPCLLVAK